jgi:hypothetical protein
MMKYSLTYHLERFHNFVKRFLRSHAQKRLHFMSIRDNALVGFVRRLHSDFVGALLLVRGRKSRLAPT